MRTAILLCIVFWMLVAWVLFSHGAAPMQRSDRPNCGLPDGAYWLFCPDNADPRDI